VAFASQGISSYAITGVSTPVQVSTPTFGQFTEPAVVTDPTNAQNMFVSSNEGSCVTTTTQAQPSFLSSNGGASWTSGASLPITAGNIGFDPAPAFNSNGTLYDSYLDVSCLSNPPQGNLVVSKSTDKGLTWSKIATLETPTPSTFPDKPMMLADTTPGSPFLNRLYVVYSRVPTLSGSQPLELNYSTDSGATWLATPKQIDAGNDTGGFLALAPANGYLYVAWWDFTHQKVRTAVSQDGGNTFPLTADHVATTTLNSFYPMPNYVGNGQTANPALAVDRSGGSTNGNLYMAWGDRVTPPATAPGLTATSGGPLAAGTYQVAYSFISGVGESAASPTTSVTLGSGQNAIQTASISNIPSTVTSIRYYLTGTPSGCGLSIGYVGSSAVSGGTASGILIATSGNGAPPPTGNMHAFFSRSINQGLNWSNPVRVDAGNPNDAWQPTLAVDQSNGRVTAAWYDRRDDSSTPNKNYLLYYTYSADGGNSFLPQQIPASTSQGDPTVDPAQRGTGDYMAISSGGGLAHPVWVETHPVNPPMNTNAEMQVYIDAIADNQPLNSWMPQRSATVLGGRDSQSMTYDAATQTVVMFGGWTLQAGGVCGSTAGNETWSFDGTNWTKLQPANPPPVRTNAVTAYDAATSKIILFGGADGLGNPLKDTWSWDGSNWTQLSPKNVPPARSGASMVYDSALTELIMFGGSGASGLLGDTWAWTGTNWSLQRGAGPSARWGSQMAYDGINNAVVLFGGGNPSTCPPTENGDTWTWNGSWTLQHPTTSPSPRVAGGMAYDSFIGKAVLFGGEFLSSSCVRTYYNDTWYWNGSNWVAQTSPSTAPTARSRSGFAYDPATNTIVMNAGSGIGAGGGDLDDTWSY